MRIAIDARKIADFGIGTYIRGLLGALPALATGDQYVALAPRDAAIPDGVEHVPLEAPHYSVRELLAVGRAAARARADLLHAPHYVVPFTSLPLVVTIHDLIHLHQRWANPLKPLYARAMLRRAVRRAGAVITVTEAVRRQIEQELGAGRVFVTPNGVELMAETGGDAVRRRYFLFVGNDKPHKNVDRLVEAFAIVREENPDVSLLLAGGSFERFSACEGVEVAGFVSRERLAHLYRNAVALVMPSLEEGFGLPAAEAMASGTAVITSQDAALVEVTGDAALHVAADDVAGLAGAMRRLLLDERLRRELATRGVDRSRSLTWSRCAELTHAAYLAAYAASRARRS